MPTHHVFDYLDAPRKYAATAVNVLFGSDPFLKQEALLQLRNEITAGDEDLPFATFDGETAEWRDVHDELATASLFGGNGRRLAIVADADTFVSRHRPKLEDYVARPRSHSVLVLIVGTWAANTRLYKAVDQTGLQIECAPPERVQGRGRPSMDTARISKWIVMWGQTRHAIVLNSMAAEVLFDLVGPNFGMLHQDLAKLALFAGSDKKITAEMVHDIVGGWRARTIWDLMDAATEGDVSAALVQLDRLLQAGANALELLGGIAWSLRRFAVATRIYENQERLGRRVPLRSALEQAGFRNWPADALPKAEQQLTQLGRERAGHFFRWLLDLDLALKGSHSSSDRSRVVLEQLLVKMSRELTPRKKVSPARTQSAGP